MEKEITPDSTPSDLLHEGLIQSIAQIRLLVRSWYEPPRIEGLHLSTFIQQLLSLIAQYGGLSASSAWTLLCGSGVFANVSKLDFALLLRELAKKEILTQTPTGLLLHGSMGEKLVNHYSFYAAFSSGEEFRLVCGGKTLGSLPLSQPVEEGAYLIFAGKRWRVQSLNIEKLIIVVTPAHAGKIPQFDGGGALVDDGVRQEMRQVLIETTPIAFLDTTAQQLLQDARTTFYSMKLDSEVVLVSANNVQLFLWQGDRIMNTIVLMLKQKNINAENAGLYINIKTNQPEKLFEALHALATSPQPDPISLVATVINKWLEKWDNLLPDELLARNYSSHTLDVVGGHQAIKTFMQKLTDYPKTN